MMEYLRLSAKNLSQRKARTALTLLGVIIGITAVVSMISIGEGMRESLKKQLEELGSDKIFVVPRFSYGTTASDLTDEDAKAIEKLFGVAFVSPLYSLTTGVEFRGEEKAVLVYGLDPEKAERTFGDAGGYSLLRGRWLAKGDRRKVVVGYGIYDDTFSRKVDVGDTIRIGKKSFQVVGVFQKTGDRAKDYTIYTSLDELRSIAHADKKLNMIVVRASPGSDVEDVRLRIEALIEKRKGSSENYFVATQKEIFEKAGEVYRVIQVVFGGLAAVSLIVGALGIANTMIMNVTERTKEIGIMKAIGASDRQVLQVFLADSLLIGFVGGLAGIALGYGISLAINRAADVYLGEGLLRTSVSPELAVLALAFSVVLGVVAGAYPAYRAAKQNPVEALRA